MTDAKHLKILIVDDSLSARAMLRQAFPELLKKYAGFDEAEDGQYGVDKFKETRHDMVFMDLTMPRMSGLEALAEIKKISPNTPVVMITADRQKETKKELLEAGATNVLNKPVDRAELDDVIKKIAFGINIDE